LFHQLRFRLRKPRPVIARADQEEQRAFKKNASDWQEERTLIYGVWMNATSCSMGQERLCEFLQRIRIPFSFWRQPVSLFPYLGRST
jgi:hypothetical protein